MAGSTEVFCPCVINELNRWFASPTWDFHFDGQKKALILQSNVKHEDAPRLGYQWMTLDGKELFIQVFPFGEGLDHNRWIETSWIADSHEGNANMELPCTLIRCDPRGTEESVCLIEALQSIHGYGRQWGNFFMDVVQEAVRKCHPASQLPQ